MKIFKRFWLYMLIGCICGLVPWLHYGVIAGFPAIVLNSIALTLLYAKDIGEL